MSPQKFAERSSGNFSYFFIITRSSVFSTLP
jgi:hypothetical protein